MTQAPVQSLRDLVSVQRSGRTLAGGRKSGFFHFLLKETSANHSSPQERGILLREVLWFPQMSMPLAVAPNSYPNVVVGGNGLWGRLLGQKDSTLRNGMIFFSLFIPHYLKIQREDGPLQTREGALTKHQVCQELDLQLQPPRNKCEK